MPQTPIISFKKAVYRLFRIIQLDKRDVFAVYFFAIFSGLVFLSLPLGIQTIIGFVIAGSFSTSIVVLIILVIMGVVINGMLQIRQLEHIEKIEQKIFVRYAFSLADKLPRVDLQSSGSYHLPEWMNRFMEVPALQKSLQKLLLDIPSAAVQVIFGTLLLSFYHPLFLGFGLILIGIVILILRFTASQGLKSALETSNHKYAVTSWLQDLSASIAAFKHAKDSTLPMQRTDKLVFAYLNSRTRHFKLLKFQYWSLVAFKVSIIAIMLILGVILLVDQQINIGQFIAADIVIIAIINSVEKFIGNFDQVYDAMTALEKLDKMVSLEEEEGGTLSAITPANFSVSLSGVVPQFNPTYRGTHAIDLELSSGQWALIEQGAYMVAPIFHYITGKHTDFKGQVMIGGLPVSGYDHDFLRSHIGVLDNQGKLFKGTILENIICDLKPKQMEKLHQLISLSGLQTYLPYFAKGLDAQIGMDGHDVSRPVFKAILLTRALFQTRSLLLLEEPFEYLSETQIKKLIQYLKNQPDLTVIAIDKKLTDEWKSFFDQQICLPSTTTSK
ncbi:MAG: ABC transporter ATP-binding protein [Saprospiraceae bacterium]|nr:ABC transporter ATP-binding protein [Saprospiraceae bacterium]